MVQDHGSITPSNIGWLEGRGLEDAFLFQDRREVGIPLLQRMLAGGEVAVDDANRGVGDDQFGDDGTLNSPAEHAFYEER